MSVAHSPQGEPYNKMVVTSFGVNLAVTPSEFMFFKTLDDLMRAGRVNVCLGLASEWAMIRDRYRLID